MPGRTKDADNHDDMHFITFQHDNSIRRIVRPRDIHGTDNGTSRRVGFRS